MIRSKSVLATIVKKVGFLPQDAMVENAQREKNGNSTVETVAKKVGFWAPRFPITLLRKVIGNPGPRNSTFFSTVSTVDYYPFPLHRYYDELLYMIHP